MMSIIVVTGITGFVGQAVYSKLHAHGHPVRKVLRSLDSLPSGIADESAVVVTGDLGMKTDWSNALLGADFVIHCAARTHAGNETRAVALAAYREVNVKGTLNLARQAARSGVRRFIFISSIKVNGATTASGLPFNIRDNPQPIDPYSISKTEAEQGLFAIARDTGMEVVCIRPPLVYGPGVKGSFLSMLRCLELGIPLPLGAIHNKRSLIGIDNLVDLIVICIDHPVAANQIFLVSDDDDLSTVELLQRTGSMLGSPARLLAVPPALLKLGARVFRKGDITQRLLGNLQVNISKTKELLAWSPPISVDEGLRKTAEWYVRQR